MALFGSSEKKGVQHKVVRPTVVRTQNVAKELASIAKSYDIKTDILDFNLLDVQTYVRTNVDEKEAEWNAIESDEVYELDRDTTLLNKNFQIKQTYEVEIFSTSKNDKGPLNDFNVAVGANASKCKVYLSIPVGAKASYISGLEYELKALINKKKIRAGILINIFDEMLDDTVAKLSAKIRVAEVLVYEQSETLLIADSFEPTHTTNDQLIFHYEENKNINENDQVDYSSRGFIQSVKEDELLIEYIKPKLGKPGRNCRGEYMEPSEPIIENLVTFGISESIKEVDDEFSTKYLAKENGYIALDGNTYLIKTDMDVGEISFKTTGSIASGLDSDVNLTVKETDAIKDAIGTGMDVEVTEIDVDGNVGSNAKVKAIKATIGGQTHSTAMIRADKLTINVHKGMAYGKDISITRLEHGKVDGNKVRIAQALGGNIRAHEIDIEICASHIKATASQKIEIHKLQGSENVFTIDPVLKKDEQAGLNENKEKIDKLEDEIKDINSEVEKYTQLIKAGTASFNDIKKRLMHYKKNGVDMPSSFVKKYKQFSKMQEHLKDINQELLVKADQLKLLTTKTTSFQGDIMDARVINRDRWIGYNEIKFMLVDPAQELIYKPEAGSLDKVFGLIKVEDEDGEVEYKIGPVSE